MPIRNSSSPDSLSKVYEQLNEHAIAIGKINSSLDNISHVLQDLSKKTTQDYKWVWGALGVIIMIVSGYTTLVANPMAERINRLETKAESLNAQITKNQMEYLKGFAEVGHKIGRIEAIPNAQKEQ